jgi:FKBP-type peptidyl-prolyl cis-trans isomerase
MNGNFLVIGSLCLAISCNSNREEKKLSDAEIKDRMANVNKIIVKDEAKDIDEFVSRHQWKMQSTGTGLRIEVYENGTGKKPTLKDTVSIAYKVYLLDGTLCYSADETHRLRFILGTGQQTSGLEEGLQLMQQGAKARMVVPSHLAYGMTGDENKIPAGNALYYEVTLLKVN